MNGYKAYNQALNAPANWTRIDLLLALYDAAIDRTGRGLALLKEGDPFAARPLLAKAQAIVLELAAGVNLEAGDPNSVNFLRLYEFFAHALAGTEVAELEAVVRSLSSVREGLGAIRAEAVELERNGAIPSNSGHRQVLAVG